MKMNWAKIKLNSDHKSKAFAVALMAMIIAKYFLVARTEMVGMQWDIEEFAKLTLVGHWGAPRDPMRPPMLGVIANLVMKFGVPWRIFLEVFFLGVAAAFAVNLRKLFGGVFSLLVSFLLMFHPYTIRSFTDFQREPFLLVLYLLLFNGLLAIVAQKRTSQPSVLRLCGIALVASAIAATREGEELLMVPVIAAVNVAASFSRLRTLWSSKSLKNFKLAFIPLFIPFIVFYSVMGIVAYLNFHFWGVPSFRGLFTEYQNLLVQVHRIKTPDSIRFAPVTKRTFQIALQKSPTFLEFGGPFATDEDPTILMYREHSYFVERREIDPSRTIWALKYLAQSHYAGDAVVYEKVRAATRELKEALDADPSLVNQPSLPFPFDSNFQNWVPSLRKEIIDDFNMLLFPNDLQYGMGKRTDWRPPGDSSLFDQALNRRSFLVAGQFEGKGHVIREKFISKYHSIMDKLLGIIACLGFIFGLRIASSHLEFVLSLSIFLSLRCVLYAVILASVAPVIRYQTFLSPVAIVLFAADVFVVSAGFRTLCLWLINRCIMGLRTWAKPH